MPASVQAVFGLLHVGGRFGKFREGHVAANLLKAVNARPAALNVAHHKAALRVANETLLFPFALLQGHAAVNFGGLKFRKFFAKPIHDVAVPCKKQKFFFAFHKAAHPVQKRLFLHHVGGAGKVCQAFACFNALQVRNGTFLAFVFRKGALVGFQRHHVQNFGRQVLHHVFLCAAQHNGNKFCVQFPHVPGAVELDAPLRCGWPCIAPQIRLIGWEHLRLHAGNHCPKLRRAGTRRGAAHNYALGYHGGKVAERQRPFCFRVAYGLGFVANNALKAVLRKRVLPVGKNVPVYNVGTPAFQPARAGSVKYLNAGVAARHLRKPAPIFPLPLQFRGRVHHNQRREGFVVRKPRKRLKRFARSHAVPKRDAPVAHCRKFDKVHLVGAQAGNQIAAFVKRIGRNGFALGNHRVNVRHLFRLRHVFSVLFGNRNGAERLHGVGLHKRLFGCPPAALRQAFNVFLGCRNVPFFGLRIKHAAGYLAHQGKHPRPPATVTAEPRKFNGAVFQHRVGTITIRKAQVQSSTP